MATPALNDGDRADLVAYLDGELEEDRASALAAKLSLDSTARAEAEQLKKTWELLDYLPKPQPSHDFTHRTLERLVADGSNQSARLKMRARVRTLAKGAAWAAAVLIAAAVGFGGSRLLVRRAPIASTTPTPPADIDAQWIKDYRVIQNRKAYELVGTVPFAKRLASPDDPDLFGEEDAGS